MQYCIELTAGVEGGAVQIYDDAEEVVVGKVLSSSLDGYIIRDADYLHGVTPLQMPPGGNDHRDVLIFRLPSAE